MGCIVSLIERCDVITMQNGTGICYCDTGCNQRMDCCADAVQPSGQGKVLPEHYTSIAP